MLKLIFELNVDDEWPPVGAESLWFDETAQGLVLKTIPFFIDGIAYDDVLAIDVIGDVHGTIRSVISPSGNSTVWIYLREGVDDQSVLSKLTEKGLGCEGGALNGYFAINLPATCRLSDLTSCLQEELEGGMAELAYGVMRHKE